MMLYNGITEAAFMRAFPRPYVVRALNLWEAERLGLKLDRTWWKFVQAFTFISDKWGPITQAEGNITDFASVPLRLRSIFDDDSPVMLYPSASHDLLFQPRPDGTRGWLADGRQLSLHQVNDVMTEAMWYCGASDAERRHVFEGLMLGNLDVRHAFAHTDAVALLA